MNRLSTQLSRGPDAPSRALARLLLVAALLLMWTSCKRAPVEGSTPGSCADRADNDDDGLFDCNDPDCTASPDCSELLTGDDDDSAGGCSSIEQLDCEGFCAPQEWLGDGQCDDSAYPYYGHYVNFACEQLNWDNGDCSESGDDDDSASPGDDDDDSVVEPWTFGEIFAFASDHCSCHSEPEHDSGFVLPSTAAQLYISWVGSEGLGQPSSQLPSMDRIEPGDSSRSYVWHKLDGTHLDQGGSGSRMPQGGPFLTPAALAGIRAWIDEGAAQTP